MNKKPLIIFEMANNHFGDFEFGLQIIREFKKNADKYRDIFEFAFKLQLRDSSIIHPDFTNRMDLSQIKRFTETRLSEEHFSKLKQEIEEQGFISMCTPFDEASVDKMLQMDFQMFKIASCSFGDWQLMQQFEKVDKPIVISTACANENLLDNVVSFFKNRKKEFSLMHCVSSYPTENKDLAINQITYLKNRYCDIPVGFSTHEHPNSLNSIFMSVAAGAVIFEKHVGITNEKYKLNAYSCTPEQINEWLCAAKDAFEMNGSWKGRMNFTEDSVKGVTAFVRGAFAKNTIKKGEKFFAKDLFLAIPNVENQLLSFDLSKYAVFTSQTDIEKNAPILKNEILIKNTNEAVKKINSQVVEMLKKANIHIPNGALSSISAHYGLDKFEECGAVIIDILNREYCKKLIVMFPNQKHPLHTHKQKEETFHILQGDLHVVLDGVEHDLKTGDLLTVNRNQKHSFDSKIGVIFEEISTTHYKNDSFYEDEKIMQFDERKIECNLYREMFL
jgi:sialic acid synthase SpsE/mannose-6-phosphate isomerase-like protein (cupin superfamily)